jgi:thymidylate synthase
MAIIQLYGLAVHHVLEGRTPVDFPWQGEKVKELQTSFDKAAMNDRYRSAEGDDTQFDYTYPELLTKQVFHDPDGQFLVDWRDQMACASEILKTAIDNDLFDTRNVGNLYEPFFVDKENKPCFCLFQVQHTGEGKVTLICYFRSHDYGTAVWANICAISYWFNEKVILPAGGILDEIIIFSASAHVYSDCDVIDKLLRHGALGRFV